MKKIILSLVFATAISTVSAQESEEKIETFNQWSIELAGGFNNPIKPVSLQTERISPYTVDLGVRYMLNNKFGLKLDAGLSSIEGTNNSFESQYLRGDLQGVVNLGRVLNFENWTQTIGLLAHTGLGIGMLSDQNSNKEDYVGNFIIGLTGQIKLSNKFVLTGDVSSIANVLQSNSFDFTTVNKTAGFSANLLTGTIGISYYLGKSAKHVDWNPSNDNKEVEAKIKGLDKKVADLETYLNDTDRDGVIDYLDAEPNSVGGVMVDTKGRAIDLNKNGVPDELESYFTKTYGANADSTSLTIQKEVVRDLINDGYVSSYFDFNKSVPTNISTEGIDFVLTYLRKNPASTVEIYGHADEIGKSAYNDKLSDARATSVKKMLMKAGIEESRLKVIAAGVDNSVEASSAEARKLVRRVTFKVN